MLYCIVTADDRELQSGDLSRFLESVDPACTRCVLVLRGVDERTMEEYRQDRRVWRVILSPKAGLSKVRNSALRCIADSLDDDDIVSFPDDDCIYPRDLCSRVIHAMDADDLDLLVGRYGETPASVRSVRPLTFGDALFRSSSVCLYVRWGVVKRLGGFNESLGVGSGNYAFGEDNDFALRARSVADRSCFDTSFSVWHLEARPTVGRNAKGYLVPALLNGRHPKAWFFVGRGVFGSVLQVFGGGTFTLRPLLDVLSALEIKKFAKAWKGERYARRLGLELSSAKQDASIVG